MDRLRTPFFVVALAAMLLVVLLEIATSLFLGGQDVTAGLLAQAGRLDGELDARMNLQLAEGARASTPPGRAIPYLALVDGIVLYTVALMGAALVLPHRLHGRLQGGLTLVGSILLILCALVMLAVVIIELVTMVALLFAFPFGTLVYLAIWGSFPRGQAAGLLSLLLFLKLVFGGGLLLAQQRFIQNKGLVLLVATSLVCNLVATFLHGLVPGILVSITDRVGAIVFAIVAIVWAIVLLVGSIPAVVKAVRSTATTAATSTAAAGKAAGAAVQ